VLVRLLRVVALARAPGDGEDEREARSGQLPLAPPILLLDGEAGVGAGGDRAQR